MSASLLSLWLREVVSLDLPAGKLEDVFSDGSMFGHLLFKLGVIGDASKFRRSSEPDDVASNYKQLEKGAHVVFVFFN